MNTWRENIDIDSVPNEYFDCYEVKLLGIDFRLFKPEKIIYNNRFSLFLYRPKLKYFIDKLAGNYDKKAILTALIEGYNEGVNEYSKTFDLNIDAAKKLLKELQRLQNIDFIRHIDYIEMTKQGFIEGSINCLHGIIESNDEIFIREQLNTKPKELTYRQVALIYQYEKWPLAESAASDLINKGTYPNIKSADHLAGTYRELNTPTQRTGEGVKTANDIKTILPYLSEKAKALAENELEKAIENQSKKNND